MRVLFNPSVLPVTLLALADLSASLRVFSYSPIPTRTLTSGARLVICSSALIAWL